MYVVIFACMFPVSLCTYVCAWVGDSVVRTVSQVVLMHEEPFPTDLVQQLGECEDAAGLQAVFDQCVDAGVQRRCCVAGIHGQPPHVGALFQETLAHRACRCRCLTGVTADTHSSWGVFFAALSVCLHVCLIACSFMMVFKSSRGGVHALLVRLCETHECEKSVCCRHPRVRVCMFVQMSLKSAKACVLHHATVFFLGGGGKGLRGRFSKGCCHMDDHLSVLQACFEEGGVDAIDAPSCTTLNTPLHLAAQRGWEEGVCELLQWGANPNSQDQDGYTALHFGGDHLRKIFAIFYVHASTISTTMLFVSCCGLRGWSCSFLQQIPRRRQPAAGGRCGCRGSGCTCEYVYLCHSYVVALSSPPWEGAYSPSVYPHPPPQKRSALHRAAEAGSIEVAELLLVGRLFFLHPHSLFFLFPLLSLLNSSRSPAPNLHPLFKLRRRKRSPPFVFLSDLRCVK